MVDLSAYASENIIYILSEMNVVTIFDDSKLMEILTGCMSDYFLKAARRSKDCPVFIRARVGWENLYVELKQNNSDATKEGVIANCVYNKNGCVREISRSDGTKPAMVLEIRIELRNERR